MLQAKQVALQLALLPLLRRTVVIDSLQVKRATLRLVRTKDGFELPQPNREATGKQAGTQEAAQSQREGGFHLAVRNLSLSATRLILEDRTISPKVVWELKDLSWAGRVEPLKQQATFDFSGALATGGTVRGQGNLDLPVNLSIEANLDHINTAPFAGYFGQGNLAGTLSGKLIVEGSPSSSKKIKADLTFATRGAKVGEAMLRGTTRCKLDMQAGPGKTEGVFLVDATDAEFAYGNLLAKPAGGLFSAKGTVRGGANRELKVERTLVQLKNLEARVEARLGKRVQVQVSAPPFDLAGWDRWMPQLAGYEIEGPVTLHNLVVVAPPVDVRGSIELGKVTVRLRNGQALIVTGTLQGRGQSIETDQMTVAAAGQVVSISGSVSGFGITPKYSLNLRTTAADLNQLLSTFTPLSNVLYGPLDLEAKLRGKADHKQRGLEALSGTVRLRIGQGRIKGVSLLQSTFEQLGRLGEAALMVGRLRGGGTLRRFYEDKFESVTGTFEISRGLATTNNLQLLYRHYKVDLWGTLGLADQELDMRGQLTIFKEVDRELANPGTRPARKTIPLARVIGTLKAPRIDLSPDAAARFAASYAIARQRGKLEQKIDDKLGRGSGKQVIDIIQGIIGSKPPPQ